MGKFEGHSMSKLNPAIFKIKWGLFTCKQMNFSAQKNINSKWTRDLKLKS